MGKGAGVDDTRDGMDLTPQCLLADLEAAVDHATSYPQYIQALERLRAARIGEFSIVVEYEQQSFDEAFAESLRENPGQVRAMFMQGSLFRDHLAYAEYKYPRVRRKIRVQRLTNFPVWDFAIPAHISAAESMQLRNEMHHAISLPVRLQDASASIDDYRTHLAYHCPLFVEHGSEDGSFDRFVEQCFDHRELRTRKQSLWGNAEEPIYTVFAEVSRDEQEARLMQLLRSAPENEHLRDVFGNCIFKITPNPLEVPNYRSQHNIQGGSRLTLEFADGGSIHYVPHYELGSRKVKEYEHRITLQGLPSEFFTQEQARIDQRFASARMALDESYTLTASSSDAPIIIHPRSGRYAQVRAAMENGELFRFGERHMKVQPATVADFIRCECTETAPGTFMSSTAAAQYRRAAAELDQLKQMQGKSVSWRSRYAGPPAAAGTRSARANYRQMQSAIYEQCPAGLSYQIVTYQREYPQLFEPTTHKQTPVKQEKQIPHVAPFSERGIIKFENMTPATASAIMQMMGLAEKPVEQLPVKLLYPGERRMGRISPRLAAYASGEADISPPPGHMIIHGMTGTSNREQVLARLDKIHESGGLKSIAERRRLGIGVETMSPRGDIASGIDTGVPCKIGSRTGYGEGVFFGLRPEAIKRRDIFFSDVDFGAGDSRYDEYTAYAARIGQGKIFESPSHRSRVKHLSHGLGGKNEVWFQHEISWEEIDTVFVSSQYSQVVTERIDGWKKRGSLPAHIRVEIFSHDLNQRITARAAMLQSSPMHNAV